MSKRYNIQFCFLEDTLTKGPVKWYDCTLGARTLRGGRKVLWKKICANHDRKLFRLFDNKTGEAVAP